MTAIASIPIQILLAVVAHASGRQGEPQPEAKQQLAAQAVSIETLGVRLQLPEGSALTKVDSSGTPAFLVDDTGEPPRFHLEITPYSAPLERTAADELAADLEKRRALDPKLRILDQGPFATRAGTGQILYTATDLDADTTAVTGWLLVPQAPGSFLAISVVTSGLDYASIRPTLDASLASLTLIDPAEAAMTKGLRLLGTKTILRGLTPERLRAACSERPRYYRIHRAQRGQPDTEIGWMRLTVREGARGEIDPSRPQPYIEEDATRGLLVLVQAQTIDPQDPVRRADTDARYWVAWDRSQEFWLLRLAERAGVTGQTYTQMGLRSPISAGAPRPTLQLLEQRSRGANPPTRRWTLPEDLYLSQAELQLIGRLLPRDGSFEGEAALYAFDPGISRIPMHLLSWQADGERWRLLLRPSVDAPPKVMEFDKDGWLVKQVEVDGTITEEADPEELLRNWRERGLPVQ